MVSGKCWATKSQTTDHVQKIKQISLHLLHNWCSEMPFKGSKSNKNCSFKIERNEINFSSFVWYCIWYWNAGIGVKGYLGDSGLALTLILLQYLAQIKLRWWLLQSTIGRFSIESDIGKNSLSKCSSKWIAQILRQPQPRLMVKRSPPAFMRV